MGWGGKTIQAISKGSLVIEYLGEVIDTNEMEVCIFCVLYYYLSLCAIVTDAKSTEANSE
jgi:hypothetical protein